MCLNFLQTACINLMRYTIIKQWNNKISIKGVRTFCFTSADRPNNMKERNERKWNIRIFKFKKYRLLMAT